MLKKQNFYTICILISAVCHANAKDMNDIPKKSIPQVVKSFNLDQFRIAKGDSISFEMPAWKGKNTVIDFYSRIDQEPKRQMQGYYALAIKINGKLVRSRYEGDYEPEKWYGRLINKPFFIADVDGKRIGAFHLKFYWNVFLSLNFDSAASNSVKNETSEKNHLVIDVTDFIKSDSNNIIEFFTNGTQQYISDIVIKDFSIREFNEETRCRSQSNLEKPLSPVVKGVFTDYSKVPYDINVNNDGTFKILNGKNTYLFESVISYPGKLGNGFVQNKNGITPEKEWTVKIEKADIHKYVIIAEGKFYKLIRTLNVKDNSIEVTDFYENKTDKDLGIYIDNFFTAEQKAEIRHLAGIPVESDKIQREENIQTSVLALNKNGGLGFIAKNHLNRSNAFVYIDDSRFGIRKKAVLFAPKAKHTLEWDIVPVCAGGDYYDFINVVRHNWKLIYEYPAVLLSPRTDFDTFQPMFPDGIKRDPVNIATMSLDETRNYLRNYGGTGTKYVVFGSVNRDEEITKKLIEKYGQYTETVQGADNLNAKKYFNSIKEVIKKMKQADPNAKAIAFFCIYINSEDPELIKIKYPDAYMRNKKDDIILYKGHPNLYNMRLTPGNSYAQMLEKVYDYFYNEVGFDGMYFDVNCHAKPQWDYTRWDGISGALTQDYQIDYKMDDSAISSEDYKNSTFKKMLKEGRCLWANIETTSLMDGIRFPIQIETSYWDYIYRSHAFSPLAWHEVKNAAYIGDLAYNIRMTLRVGALSVGDRYFMQTPNHPISYSKMYPMTVSEIHEGYILGPNKIITIRAGRFGWKINECKNIEPFVFDKHEMPVERNYKMIKENEYQLIDIELQPGDLAVLERAS